MRLYPPPRIKRPTSQPSFLQPDHPPGRATHQELRQRNCLRPNSRRNQNPYNDGGHGSPMIGSPMQPPMGVFWGIQQPQFYQKQAFGGMKEGMQPGVQMQGGGMNQSNDQPSVGAADGLGPRKHKRTQA